MYCSHCKTSQFVRDDPTNGCYVCTSCGLVVVSTYFDESPTFDKANDSFSNSVVSDPFSLNCTKLKRQSNISFFSQQDPNQLKRMKFSGRFNSIFNSFQLHDSLKTKSLAMYLDFEKYHNFKGRNLNHIVPAFIYIASKDIHYSLDVLIFGQHLQHDIMKSVTFIQDTLLLHKPVQPPNDIFTDSDIESFILSYSKFINVNRSISWQIIKSIHLVQFIMRKKEILAIALIVHFFNDTNLIKPLSSATGFNINAIKAALQDLLPIH